MKKRNLPTGVYRKRWIDRLTDEQFNSLNQKDKENYLRFQRYSSIRETKLKSIQQYKEKIKILKDDIRILEEKEESNFIKVQFLHNVFGCRIDVIRQERKPSSLKITSSGGTKKSFIRKTYKGEKLTNHFVYHGKIVSKSLEKNKNVYFQEEKKLINTINELTGKDISKLNKDEIKNFLQRDFKDYVIYLMRKVGSEKFTNYKVSFLDFTKWYKREKIKVS